MSRANVKSRGMTEPGRYLRVPSGGVESRPSAVICPYCEQPMTELIAPEASFARVIETKDESKKGGVMTTADILPAGVRLLSCRPCDAQFTQPPPEGE